jgi:hypothetical protein
MRPHLEAKCALLDLLDEAAHHRQADVSLQQRSAHITQRALQGVNTANFCEKRLML